MASICGTQKYGQHVRDKKMARTAGHTRKWPALLAKRKKRLTLTMGKKTHTTDTGGRVMEMASMCEGGKELFVDGGGSKNLFFY